MVLVSQRPTLYRHARNLHHECGPYQLRAALNAFGKDAEPQALYWSDWMRRLDWSLPPLMPSILQRYNIYACCRFWFTSSFKGHLLGTLTHNKSVLFVVDTMLKPGDGFHWISAWGYDQSSDEFLCYDAKAPEAHDVPGNIRYSTPLLLAHLPWRGTFVLIIEGAVGLLKSS